MSSLALDAIESDDELHSGKYLFLHVHLWSWCQKCKHKLGQNRHFGLVKIQLTLHNYFNSSTW